MTSNGIEKDSAAIKKSLQDNFIIDNTSTLDGAKVYMYCEKMPSFPGGDKAFIDFMKNNIKYPKAAINSKKEGRVVVKFIIDKNGEAKDIQVIRKLKAEMDTECLRVVNAMPRWEPGTINGNPVPVSYNVTIRFLLNKSENLNGICILP